VNRPNPALIREREEAAKPAGEVRTYFDPQWFTWFKPGGAKGGAYISITDKNVFISAEARRLAGLEAGDRVLIGFNNKFVAVRKAADGFLLTVNHGAKINTPRLRDFPVKGRIEVTWDGQMLVGRRSEDADRDNRISRNGQDNPCESDSGKV
jgi:hypothetical protein